MASILKISDGATTVDFLASDGIYRVTAWAPAVAGRRASAIGGRGPYEDVVEQMEISVKGATAASSLETLQRLLDQATRWGMGEMVDAVVLSFKPTATSDELKAVILGPAAPGEAMMELPENVVNAAALGMIEPVVLRFRRTGVWLGASVTSQSAVVTNPNIGTVTGLTSMNAASPFLLRLAALPEREDVISDAFILVTTGTNTTTADRIAINAAWELTGLAGQFSTVTETTTNASGNKVLRFTVGTANKTEESWFINPGTADFRTARRYAAFVNRRNNSSSGTFQVRMKFSSGAVRGTVYTPWVTIEKNGTTSGKDTGSPLYMMLGMVSAPGPISTIALQARGDTVSATLDFDTVALLAMDNEEGDRAVAILAGDGTPMTFTSADFNIDHRLLTDTTPAAWFDTSDGLYQPYQGDLSLWLPAGHTVVKAAWLGTRSAGITPDRWRATNTSGTAVANRFWVVQSKAYLIPR